MKELIYKRLWETGHFVLLGVLAPAYLKAQEDELKKMRETTISKVSEKDHDYMILRLMISNLKYLYQLN